MNILTFDIEEWALEQARPEGVRPDRMAQYDIILDKLLNLLQSRNMHATFFCTGMMAKQFPHVLHRIADDGHEIGCHSHLHTWCNKMSEHALQEDTHNAVATIEDCIGKKVLAYRAPAFSITKDIPYAFQILAREGILYDSSIFPTSRDFGGWPNFGYDMPTRIFYKGIEIKEFPIPLMSIFGSKIAYSGGGYFRLLPYSIINARIKRSNYTMTYFHINDLLTLPHKMMTRGQYERYFKEPGTLVNRTKRFLKSNIGTSDAFYKMNKLIYKNDFINIAMANELINWQEMPSKKL